MVKGAALSAAARCHGSGEDEDEDTEEFELSRGCALFGSVAEVARSGWGRKQRGTTWVPPWQRKAGSS